jgi:hypothetical protein
MTYCFICKELFSEPACSAYPIAERVCCPRCDDLIVTPLRILDAQLGFELSSEVLKVFRQAIELRAATVRLKKRT